MSRFNGSVQGRAKRLARMGALAMALAAFGVVEAHAATSSSLDLVCGSQSGLPIRFRIDLQQGKWCYAGCQSVWFIDKLDDAMISLSVRNKNGSEAWKISIDRATSRFSAEKGALNATVADWGSCAVEPFSGFPRKYF